MISEVDLADWEKVGVAAAKNAMAKIYIDKEFYKGIVDLNNFIHAVEELREKQMKNIPKLLRKN